MLFILKVEVDVSRKDSGLALRVIYLGIALLVSLHIASTATVTVRL
jgi:hypothetical protein